MAMSPQGLVSAKLEATSSYAALAPAMFAGSSFSLHQAVWTRAAAATSLSAYILAEVILGVVAHSLSLLADAGHNLSDVLGLLMAWGAAALSTQRPWIQPRLSSR